MNELHLQRLLMKNTKLSQTELTDLNHEAVKTESSLEDVVLRRGVLTRDALYELIARESNLPFIDLASYEVGPEAIQAVPAALARRLHVVPLFIIGNGLTVATANTDDIAALDEVRRETGREVNFALATPEGVTAALDRYYTVEHAAAIGDAAVELEADEALRYIESEDAPRSIEELAGEAPVVRFVNTLLAQAVTERASDIHIEPEQDDLRIRTRVDGLMKEAGRFPTHLHSVVASRIKILSNMDISERRRPQDGQFEFTTDHRRIDVRVSTYPTIYGENVVLRLLDRSQGLLRPGDVGMTLEVAQRFQALIHQPHGIILVTGPTGSGKTTTLYAALTELNTPVRNIMTLEDPVEYHLPMVRQSQVNPRAGVTFASGLRSILRQDPDVIMVGEIRDAETAEIAFQAALTGHLVLSTLHTNDAASGLTRMIDMNVEPFLISSSVLAILAQRLVRRACERCRESYSPAPEVLARLGIEPGAPFTRGRGCPVCSQRGYRGRAGIFELMPVTAAVRRMVMERRSSEEVKGQALKDGMRTMREDGVDKARAGLTTPEEILRVTQDCQ
jgi:type IV pilus assembly protein PilB